MSMRIAWLKNIESWSVINLAQISSNSGSGKGIVITGGLANASALLIGLAAALTPAQEISTISSSSHWLVNSETHSLGIASKRASSLPSLDRLQRRAPATLGSASDANMKTNAAQTQHTRYESDS